MASSERRSDRPRFLRPGGERRVRSTGGAVAIVVAGVSHRGASLDVREKIAYRSAESARVVADLLRAARAREGVLISTCNRTEFYLVEGDGDAAPTVWTELTARLGEDATPFGYVR